MWKVKTSIYFSSETIFIQCDFISIDFNIQNQLKPKFSCKLFTLTT